MFFICQTQTIGRKTYVFVYACKQFKIKKSQKNNKIVEAFNSIAEIKIYI